MIATIKSYIAALQASRCLGRTYKLLRAGSIPQAASMAREGLNILSQSGIRRANPAEGAVLLSLVVELEQLRHEHQVEGAAERDLIDAYFFIKAFPAGSHQQEEYAEWLPYFESRLGYTPGK